MKKTLNINLGGMAFTMDENAYEKLYTYLEALKKKFGNEAERREILNDIEARIAEMFTEKLGDRKQVVEMEEVDEVIRQMGQPEDIAGDEPSGDENSQSASASSYTSSSSSERSNKRLFRDPDDSKVGGVIAGLCHYFGINDPVWVRIAALILIPVTSGSIILLYLLLLIVIPKATTAAEKLQMKGEPININTIEKEVKDAAGRFSATVKASVDSESVFQKLWDIFLFVGRAVLRLLAVVLIIVSLICLFAVFIGFFMFFILGTTPFNSITQLVVSQSALVSIASIGMLLFLGVPLVALIYLGLSIMVGHRSPRRWLKWLFVLAWLCGLCMLLYSGISTGIDFTSETNQKEHISLMQPSSGTLFVRLADSTAAGWAPKSTEADDDEEETNSFGVVINGKNLSDIQSFKIGKPDIELMASENDSFYLQRIMSSRGRNRADALHNIKTVMYAFAQSDTMLNLSPYFEIAKKEGKYRAQEMTIRIAVPEGKKIRFGKNIDELNAVVLGDDYYNDTYFANTTWTVTNEKVKCLTCAANAKGQNTTNANSGDNQTTRDSTYASHDQHSATDNQDY